MLVDDLYLYAAFAVGWLIGRRWPSRHPWLARATLGSVGVLLFLLGASFRAIAPAAIEQVFPLAAAFAATALVVTAGLSVALRRRRSGASRSDRLLVALVVVLVLGLGACAARMMRSRRGSRG